ncbi:MAG: hypothetical protein KA807_09150 [Prolixibacteraceae bacterium]|nr:hypothetical protein [Prolixibacteraceae bacterium]
MTQIFICLMLKGVLLLSFVLLGLGVFSSNNQISFKRITVSEGLSNSWVRCIYQDESGYIWFGTSDGLNRYDGKNIKVFRPGSSNNYGMGNININYISKLDSQNIWICSDLGLLRFNLTNSSFLLDTILPPNPVLTVAKDKENNFWIGTNRGVVKYNQTENKIIRYQTNNSSLSDNYINTIFVDSKNRIWIGTKNGLNLYNKENDSFTTFLPDKNSNSISGKDITSICEDSFNHIWIGTSLDGLNKLKEKNNQYFFEVVIKGTIYSLLADNDNKLWIGHGSNEGIDLLNLNDYSIGKTNITHLKNDPLDYNSIGDNSIFTLYQDKFNDIWVGTFGGGVNYYSKRSKKFHVVKELYGSHESIKNNLVNTFFEEDNYLWIGTEGGLDRLNKKTGKYDHYQYESNNPRSLASNPVYAITKDSKGNLWVGTWAGGLHLYNYNTNDFTRFLPGGEGTIGSGNIFDIVEDKYGNLWIGTGSGGLNKYDYKTGKFKKYIRDDKDPNSLNGRSMSHVMQTSDGKLIICLYAFIDEYDYQNDRFIHLERKKQTSEFYERGNILSVFEDSKKNFWVATNAGIEYFDKEKDSLITYTTKEGLPDNTIHGILEDSHGNLWISTNKGISKFVNGIETPSRPIFLNYTSSDGISSNDLKKKAVYKNKDGVFYFGSSHGFTYFHPDSISINELVPSVVLTQLMLLETNPNKNSKFREISNNINMIKELDLYYPNTDFSISYSALNFLNAEKNQYKFKLEGYDTEWIDAGNATSATYTNISEGKYTFKVMGANNDGIWNNTPKEIVINIHPPWWRSIYFKIISILVIILSTATFIAVRFFMLNKEKKLLEAIVEKRTNELTKLNWLLERKQSIILEQNSELEKHRNNLEEIVEKRTAELASARIKAEESDKLKSAFLANMSHEIRTPMNAIIGFSNLLSNQDISDEKRLKYIDLIKNNSKQLSVLINDIIDISIIEANKMVLTKGKFSVDSILKELYEYFLMENHKKIDFKYFNINDNYQLFVNTDAIRFRQIIINLLSNAFKYTDKGSITFGYEVLGENVRFFVKDTGSGIDISDKEKVFDHFFKSSKDKMKLYRGTGIGLAICKSLVEQMGGKIWVDSQINVGSEFSFTLPVN